MPEYSSAENELINKIHQVDLQRSLSRMRQAVEEIWSDEAPRIIPGYTNHGVKHCERLAANAVQLLEAYSGHHLSDKELYLLLAGIYMHDIGMQCDVLVHKVVKQKAQTEIVRREGASSPRFDTVFTSTDATNYSPEEQKAIRKFHHYLSIAWIAHARLEGDPVLGDAAKAIPAELIADLLDICVHHTKLPITACPVDFTYDGSQRKQFVAALLRFADELDITATRVNLKTVITFRLDPTNAVYWWLHWHTHISFETKHLVRIILRLNPSDADEYGRDLEMVFLDTFKHKNAPVLDVLARNSLPMVISSEESIMPDPFADRLPPEIAEHLLAISGLSKRRTENPSPPKASLIEANHGYPPNHNVETGVSAATVRERSEKIRNALKTYILPHISRSVVHERYLPAIQRSISAEKARIIPIAGPAGYGKTTVLGEIYDELVTTHKGWIGFVDGNEIVRELAAENQLFMAVGKCLCGTAVSVTDIVDSLTRACGRGILLLDTLDRILNSSIVPSLQEMFLHLIAKNATVVFTCRDFEYESYLLPSHEKLGQVAQSIDHYKDARLHAFTTDEVVTATLQFVDEQSDIAFPDGGRAFAESLPVLSADDKPLYEIVHNPLFLALLCELFAKDGHLPSNLTVSKLYQMYWMRKVTGSRMYDTNSPEIMAKEARCLRIAEVLAKASKRNLVDAIDVLDEINLRLPQDQVQNDARTDLFSEGVLKKWPDGGIRFFHQTFLEYAIARWLGTRSGQAQRKKILQELKRNSPGSHLHWWPIIRQLLALIDHQSSREFLHIANALDQDQLPAFRATAFGAASREEPGSLKAVLPWAITLGEEHQHILLEALDSVAEALSTTAWEIILALLQQGTWATAVNAATGAGVLFRRWQKKLSCRLEEALLAIEQRILASPEGRERISQRSQLVGWLLWALIKMPSCLLDQQDLKALVDRYKAFNDTNRATIFKLHLVPGVVPEAKGVLLAVASECPLPSDMNNEAVQLLEQVLPELIK